MFLSIYHFQIIASVSTTTASREMRTEIGKMTRPFIWWKVFTSGIFAKKLETQKRVWKDFNLIRLLSERFVCFECDWLLDILFKMGSTIDYIVQCTNKLLTVCVRTMRIENWSASKNDPKYKQLYKKGEDHQLFAFLPTC